MPPRKRLGQLLTELGVVDEHQLQSALGHQKQWGGKLGAVLVQKGFCKEADVVVALSKHLNMPAVKLAEAKIDERAVKFVSKQIAEKLHVFPYEISGTGRSEVVTIAMSDPTDLSAVDQLAFHTGKRIKPMLAGDSEIVQAIQDHYAEEKKPAAPVAAPPPGRPAAGAATPAAAAPPPQSQSQEFPKRVAPPGAIAPGASATRMTPAGGAPYGNMNIVWTDEFDGVAIKTNLWTYDLGNNGWGNSELEYYTSRTNNAFVTNGILHIVARKESFGGASYTSARMKSQGLFSLKYGRLEWRAKSPAGTGFWPALWLLGTNITSINWPGCGEIDVFENNGSSPLAEQGSLHSGSDTTAFYNFIDGSSVTNFHTYTLDWTTNAILFSVDGHLYQTQTSWGSSTANAYPFPFNQPFFLLMNLAIGGSYLGNPTTNAINAGSVFPGEVQVDYVRLYNVTDPFRLAVKTTGSNLLLTWPSNIVSRVQTQTNLAANGTNWIQVATTTNQLQVSPTNKSAFYRLVMP